MNGFDANMRNVGWALLRVAVGVMFLTHGYGKIFGGADRMTEFTGVVGKLGFPYPEAFAWAEALTELVGGGLIAIGLFTRPAALFAAISMAVAVYATRDHGFSGFELALLYLVCHVVFLLGGAGVGSFDAVIKERRARASSAIFK